MDSFLLNHFDSDFKVESRFPLPIIITYCDVSITIKIRDFYEFISHNKEHGNEIFNLKNAYINIHDDEKICLDDDIPVKKKLLIIWKSHTIQTHYVIQIYLFTLIYIDDLKLII